MTERREKRRVQQAFDATLTGLMEDPWLAQRVMVQVRAQSQQDEPVKGRKKLSVGLVLVLAIMLVVRIISAIIFDGFITPMLADGLVKAGVLKGYAVAQGQDMDLED